MKDLLLAQLRDHKPAAGLALAAVYYWSTFYRTSYLAFLSGMFTTLIIEAILFWVYLGTRAQLQNGQKLTLDLAKVEAKKVFGNDIGVNYHEVELKLKKKKYYENNKSKPLFSIETYKPKIRVEPPVDSPLLKEDSSIAATDSLMLKSPTFSHKQINDLLKMKEKDLNREKVDAPIENIIKKPIIEDKVTITKIGHKAFIEQLSSFLNILGCIGTSEKSYGKALSSFDPKHIPQDDSPFVKPEEITLNLVKIRSLNEKDLGFLEVKFGKEFVEKKYIHLPDWKKLRQTINFVGQIHGNCSTVVNKVSIPNINKLLAEYEEKYQERKKEKKKLTREYEEIHLTYTKLKTEHETLTKTLETTLSEYQAKYKKKRDDEVVLKQEMKARLVKSQLDTLSNKLSSAWDKLQEANRAMIAENNKIVKFTHQWDEKKETVCFEILKNIIIELAKNSVDAERSFEILFQTRSSATQSKDDIFDPKDKRPAVPEETKLEQSHSDAIDRLKDLEIKQVASPLADPNSIKAKARPKRSSFKGKEADENKVTRMVEDFKDTIEEFTQVYETDLGQYNEENKKSRDIAGMLKQLGEYEEEYSKEKGKLVSFNFLNLKVDMVATCWKMIQNNVYLVNRYNTHLHERLATLEKSYEEFNKNQEKDLKACDLILQNAFKRASGFIKNIEKEIQKREVAKDKKFFSKLLHRDEKEGEIDENSIIIEKCTFTEEIEKGLAQINTLIVRSQRKATVLKKDILIAYLKCFNGQKDLSQSLTNETEKLAPIDKSQDATKDDTARNEVSYDIKENIEDTSLSIKHYAQPRISSVSESQNEEHKEPDSAAQSVIQQAPKVTGPDNNTNERLGAENLMWLNKLFKVFAMEWSKSGYFKEKMSKSFFRAFNKKPSKFVRRIKIKDFIIEPKFPDIRSITPLLSDSFEFLVDVEMAYQGNILLEIETRLEPQPVISIFSGDQPIPLTAKILLKALNAKVRLCWVPSEYGRSWYSFVGQPILNLSVEPKIGASQFDITVIPQATSIITELIMRKIKKMTYPYRKELDLPMAFRDPKIVPPPE